MAAPRVSVNTREERILLAAARAGDELAFGRLASRYRAGLELFCQLMLGCPRASHHAVCETLLRGWSELRRGQPSSCARIWFYRLATDVCLEDLEATDESRGPRPFDGVRDRNQRSP
jgi:RNA polymerase sigma-70 factor, ECF subfamily